MKSILMALVAMMLSSAVEAKPLESHAKAWLEATDGTRIEIADIDWAADGQFAVTMNESAFSDHFLSMRPFRCLSDSNRQWCHVPYPYATALRAQPGDLTDLEYAFLFVSKDVGDYGIDLWNGVYYVLSADGARLVGRQHGVDLNLLAVPPAEGEMRPIRAKDLTLTDPSESWLPRLVIE